MYEQQVVEKQVAEKQLQDVPSESPTVEKRGNTVMQSVHGRQECELVVLNRYNQPVGPTNVVVTMLGSFLGTLSRNVILSPLNIHNWKNMDTKKDLWGLYPGLSSNISHFSFEHFIVFTKIQNKLYKKYDIPDSAKEWALEGIKTA
ncbi:hypothetical protein H5410_014919 [Solanum commersonii]|uniref:Uncharacterized protein n=1 Tax=Solanum commersonii TaxID=4109 RepID=A0A9J5ZSW2_SOLCO|nr:hypothetical protein H5410_014919 [Solanum commersonii]